ncbi:MAG: GtrA family protein [Alphaproteobacteria bacterium]
MNLRFLNLLSASREFRAFCVVGTIGFIIDAGLVQLLVTRFGVDVVLGRVPSLLTAVTVTWLLNRRFTFRVTARRSRAEWFKYVAVNSVGNGLNFGVYALAVQTVDFLATFPFLAVAMGSAVGLAFNFTLSKTLVFKGQAAGSGSED